LSEQILRLEQRLRKAITARCCCWLARVS